MNSPLALHVDAQATLLRANDGREICSCPVQYLGLARKFTAWAADDARLLEEELHRCYAELSDAVIAQLTERQLLAPGEKPDYFLAGRAKAVTQTSETGAAFQAERGGMKDDES